MTLPVVWLPEASADLEEARAWYENIRPELGERFALAVERTVEEQSRNTHCNFRSCIGDGGVPEFGFSLTVYSSRSKSIGLW